MALAQKTDILFLDEPTTYLDIFYQLEILALVKKLNREYGMTIVMVLHDIHQAMQFSHNLIIMSKGSICYQGNVRRESQSSASGRSTASTPWSHGPKPTASYLQAIG